MDAKELLIKNIDMLCDERKWNRRSLAKKMGIMEASLSRSLNGNPTLETLEKIAKALDVSIKSLFNDPANVEGFILLNGKPYHFNSKEELTTIEQRSLHSSKSIGIVNHGWVLSQPFNGNTGRDCYELLSRGND